MLYQRRVEERLLFGLQQAVLQPEAVEYALAKFEHELRQRLDRASGEIDVRRKRKEALEIELARLAEAVAHQGASPALMEAISKRESERRELEETLWGSGPGSVQAVIGEVREFAMGQLKQVRSALHAEPEAAKFELSRHIDGGIEMRPTVRNGKEF